MLKYTLAALLAVASLLSAQNIWDSGHLEFQYGSPFPNQSVEIDGSFIPDSLTQEGLGGFWMTDTSSHQLMALAYEMEITEADTLADLFYLYMSSSEPFAPGQYMVMQSEDVTAMMVWIEDIRLEDIMAIVDSSLSFESIADLNPYLSISGILDLVVISPENLLINFAGMLANTSLQVMNVVGGELDLNYTLPVLTFPSGHLMLEEDAELFQISGPLNPLTSVNGVGGMVTEGDLLTQVDFFAYRSAGDDLIDLYLLHVEAGVGLFPESGYDLSLQVPALDDSSYASSAVILKGVQQSVLFEQLQGGEIDTSGLSAALHLPVSSTELRLINDGSGQLQASFEDLPFMSLNGESILVSEDWIIGNVLSIHDDPSNPRIVRESFHKIQAFPNPFNAQVTIPLDLIESPEATLRIFDERGRLRAEYSLDRRDLERREKHLDLSNTRLGSGIYLFQISSGGRYLGSGNFVLLK